MSKSKGELVSVKIIPNEQALPQGSLPMRRWSSKPKQARSAG